MKSELTESDERDELHRALKSAHETQVLVCADEWLSVFTDYVGRLGNEQEAKLFEAEKSLLADKELEQPTCENDVAVETEIREQTVIYRDSRTLDETARDWDPRTQDEAETWAAAATAVALNTKGRATFEGQSSDRIAKSDVVNDTMSATVSSRKIRLSPTTSTSTGRNAT